MMLKMRLNIFGWLVVLGLSLVSCGGTQESSAISRVAATRVTSLAQSEPSFARSDAAEAEIAGDFAAEAPSTSIGQQETNIPDERLIIRTAELDIVVPDTQGALEQISRLADEMGGWVVSSSVFNMGTADRGNINIRVPADRFEEALALIKDSATDVNSETTRGQDVTEEFVDLRARLENLEATADRVRAFLDDARRVEEALAVNQELSRLEEEIERIKGRIQFLNQSAAFSTINVSLTPDILNQPIEIAGWRPQGVAREAIETLIRSLQGLATVAIWLVIYFVPLALLLGLPVFVIGRWGIRRWRRRGRPVEADQ